MWSFPHFERWKGMCYNNREMPSWNIHLEAGKRLLLKLHFDEKKEKEFLVGCLLPDINNGYINKPSVVKEHGETHYAYDQKSSLNFYAENREKIEAREPIYLGYLFHLYTDGFFNYDFYRNVKRHPLGEGKTHEEKQRIKHHDFWLFDTKFHHKLGISADEARELAKKANEISVVEIRGEDLMDVEAVLLRDDLNEALKNDDYIYYSEKGLFDLMEDMIESFCNDYLGGENA